MNRFGKIWNTITTVLVAIVVIFAVLLVGVRVIGFKTYTVISGSMEPNYHVGSIVYVKPVDPFTLKENDVITFMLDEKNIATHRIIEVLPDDEDPSVVRFRTKGDANNVADGNPVHCENIIGKVVFTIPVLGYISNFIQHPPGMYFAIAAVFVLVLLVFLPGMIFKDDNKEKEGAEKENDE
ncbi:MAG: signal peptidase I [Clostridia bacterium]|nr:signal peptidase I [Clostridia bacterium]